MPNPDLSPVFEALAIAPEAGAPLHRQLYEELRHAVLDGRLAAGARLPSTRTLAARLRLSRNTVLGAFAQLLAEGYLEGRVGSGTYVACKLPDDLLEVRGAPAPRGAGPRGRRGLSKRGRVIADSRTGASLHPSPEPAPFRIGRPDLAHFPFERWARLSARRWRHATAALVSYGDPAGYAPLREAIAAHLHAARGVRGSADQVILTAGSLKALVAFALLGLLPEVLGSAPELTRTATFTFMAAGQLLFAYPARRTDLVPGPNRAVHIATAIGFAAQALVTFFPPLMRAFDVVPLTGPVGVWVAAAILVAWGLAEITSRLIWRGR